MKEARAFMKVRLLTAGALTLAFAVGFGLRARQQPQARSLDTRAVVVLKQSAPDPDAPVRLDPAARQQTAESQLHEGRTGAPALDYIHPYFPKYHDRDPSEWQGMRVDLSAMPPCERTSDCGLARACLQGKCGPCQQDGDCSPGETCALDHCVIQELAGCRNRKTCDDVPCILTGYTADLRGNKGLKSVCLTADQVPPQVQPEYPPSAYVSPPSRTKRFLEILRSKPR